MDLGFQNGKSPFHSLAGWMKEDTMRVATLESPDLGVPHDHSLVLRCPIPTRGASSSLIQRGNERMTFHFGLVMRLALRQDETRANAQREVLIVSRVGDIEK